MRRFPPCTHQSKIEDIRAKLPQYQRRGSLDQDWRRHAVKSRRTRPVIIMRCVSYTYLPARLRTRLLWRLRSMQRIGRAMS